MRNETIDEIDDHVSMISVGSRYYGNLNGDSCTYKITMITDQDSNAECINWLKVSVIY